MSTVELFFDFRSPYSYLAQTQLGGVDVAWRPMDVLQVMQLVGNTPTTVVCEAKGRYARHDLRRWAGRYGVPFSPNPKMREIDGRRLLRAALAADAVGRLAEAGPAIFRAMWGEPAPLDAPEAVAAVLAAAGVELDPESFDDPALDATLTAASEAAAARGVFGAPTFLVGEDMYFGNDRLDFLRERLGEAA